MNEADTHHWIRRVEFDELGWLGMTESTGEEFDAYSTVGLIRHKSADNKIY